MELDLSKTHARVQIPRKSNRAEVIFTAARGFTGEFQLVVGATIDMPSPHFKKSMIHVSRDLFTGREFVFLVVR